MGEKDWWAPLIETLNGHGTAWLSGGITGGTNSENIVSDIKVFLRAKPAIVLDAARCARTIWDGFLKNRRLELIGQLNQHTRDPKSGRDLREAA